MKWCYSLEYYFLFNGTAQRQDRRKKPRQYRVEGPCYRLYKIGLVQIYFVRYGMFLYVSVRCHTILYALFFEQLDFRCNFQCKGISNISLPANVMFPSP